MKCQRDVQTVQRHQQSCVKMQIRIKVRDFFCWDTVTCPVMAVVEQAAGQGQVAADLPSNPFSGKEFADIL